MRAKALQLAGLLAHLQGDGTAAVSYLQESLPVLRAGRDAAGVADALVLLGYQALIGGDDARARALHREAIALFRLPTAQPVPLSGRV